MRKLVQLCMFVALGLGVLTACDNGEAVSAARISVAKSPTTTAEPTTTTPPPLAQAPKPAPSTKSAAPPPPPASGAPAAKPVSTVEPLRLTVATNPKLGKIVTDGQGRTLYGLDTDTVKPPASNCTGDCAKRFPPVLLTDGIVRAEGIDTKLVGTITRPDKTIQLTLAGRPLYRYAGDTAPGDAAGHGLAGGFAVTATGGKVTTKTA